MRETLAVAFLLAQAVLVHWVTTGEHPPAVPDLTRFPAAFGRWRQVQDNPVDPGVRKQLMVEGLNRQLKGWKNYFDYGYPRVAFGEINSYIRDRLTQHLRRRSQRPFRPPEGVSYYEQIQRFGLVRL